MWGTCGDHSVFYYKCLIQKHIWKESITTFLKITFIFNFCTVNRKFLPFVMQKSISECTALTMCNRKKYENYMGDKKWMMHYSHALLTWHLAYSLVCCIDSTFPVTVCYLWDYKLKLFTIVYVWGRSVGK